MAGCSTALTGLLPPMCVAPLTVAEQQEDEGLVPHQVGDGPLVGVVVSRAFRQHGLGVAGRQRGAVLND